MTEHSPGPDDTWQLLRDTDVKWICSRLSRAQMTMPPASLDALDWMWQQRYAQDIPILLDALTRGEQRIAALEAALALARAAASAAWGLHVDGPPGTPCYHVDVARIDDLRNALLATRAGADASEGRD